jgi:cytochrome oxidase Cu insertion factor (SCO1/SenC/PrrC family)
MSAQLRRALITLGTLLLCLSPISVRAQREPERSAAELMDVLMWNREPVGGPFALVDHTGRQRTEADFRGKLLLLYFGFTYCPDVCPTDLQSIGLAIDQLGKAGEEVQPLFVTLDPDRDTPQHLANYVPLFHPRLVGLTGDASSIRQAAPCVQSLLCQGSDDRRRLYGRPFRLHLSDGPSWAISRVFSAWHAARPYGGCHSAAAEVAHRPSALRATFSRSAKNCEHYGLVR